MIFINFHVFIAGNQVGVPIAASSTAMSSVPAAPVLST